MKAYLQVWTVVLTFLGRHRREINNHTKLKLLSKALAHKFTELNFNIELNSKGVKLLLGISLTLSLLLQRLSVFLAWLVIYQEAYFRCFEG